MIFRARYVDARGQIVQADLRADSTRALHEDLAERGGLLLDAQETHAAEGVSRSGLSSRRLLRVLDSLRTALSAGVPVYEALSAIERQVAEPNTKAVVAALRKDVEVGEPLHRAMAQQGAVFDRRMVAMVAAGERSNSLDRVLAQIVSTLEWRRDLRAHTVRALTYPLIVLLATSGLFAFLLLYLMPSLAGLVEQSPNVPDLARSFVHLSLWLEGHLELAAMVCALGAFGVWSAVRTPVRRGRLVDLLLRLPILRSVGDAFDKLRLCRTLQVLLSSGIPFTKAFQLASEAVQSAEIRAACGRAYDGLLQGERPGHVFSENVLLDPLACSAVSVADRAGQLEDVFGSLGRSLERDVRERVAKVVALIEPGVTIALGVLVGAIAALVVSTLYGSIGGLTG